MVTFTIPSLQVSTDFKSRSIEQALRETMWHERVEVKLETVPQRQESSVRRNVEMNHRGSQAQLQYGTILTTYHAGQ